jgi:hypothetical protein
VACLLEADVALVELTADCDVDFCEPLLVPHPVSKMAVAATVVAMSLNFPIKSNPPQDFINVSIAQT